METTKNLVFTVQTLQVKDGKSLKSIEPDSDGVYKNVPLLVLGMVSRNNAFYDVASMVDSIVNPNSRFNKNLVEGNLEGEWGHPLIKDTSDLARLLVIDRTKVSHYFTKVFTKKTEDGQYTLVCGDVVPYGPYGKYLIDSFADSKRNTSFSLRSLTTKPNIINGVQHKKVLSLITIDAVDGCGFEQASKRFISNDSTESISAIDAETQTLEYEVSSEELVQNGWAKELIGIENITNQQVLDMLESNEVTVRNEIFSAVCLKTKSLVSQDGRRSMFHTLFK